ncbi:hypothetical protein AVEN_205261-1 [Araneus ventricosus]|uniref:Uncharacterized protein n=1 Tax=Araneus ventricosus TaxID=182803 RepID=A0A4Y2EHZ5_ARAVE|nr:hypothetical protein AVEN_205261-1 [Araneus ventricosus]
MADFLAMTAITTAGFSIHHVPLPRYRLKCKLTEWAMKEWQEQWDLIGVGRSTYEVLPKVLLKPAGWPRELTIFVSGHGPCLSEKNSKASGGELCMWKIRKSIALCNRMSSRRVLPFHETCRSKQGSLEESRCREKLSRNKIVQLVRFLADNESLIKIR